MNASKLATLGAGIALAAGLVGCSTTYNPPEERVAVVTPPVVTVPATASASMSAGGTTNPGITLGMKATGTPGMMQLQSFAGDVCLQDTDGNANIAHCVCQQINCSCQNTGTSCKP